VILPKKILAVFKILRIIFVVILQAVTLVMDEILAPPMYKAVGEDLFNLIF